MKIIKVITKIIIIIFLFTFILSRLINNLEFLRELLRDYDEIIELSTSLLLAYVTWQYAHASQKTLKFMKYSFEKEYEEDIKFMFININNNQLFNYKNLNNKDSKLIVNEVMLKGEEFESNNGLKADSNLLCIRLFNSGRRLISHIKVIYRIYLFDVKDKLIESKNIETIVPKTIQPNDYVSVALVKIDKLAKIEIKVESLKSFNGLGKEQIDNSPQNEIIYYNRSFKKDTKKHN